MSLCAAWSGRAPEHLSGILATFESGLTSCSVTAQASADAKDEAKGDDDAKPATDDAKPATSTTPRTASTSTTPRTARDDDDEDAKPAVSASAAPEEAKDGAKDECKDV